MAVPDSALPQLFLAADRASMRGQRTYLWGTRLRLGLVVGAAACGITAYHTRESHVDLLGLLSLLLFVGALIAELLLWRGHPEQTWYDGRALAESVKTLAWKYAAGGEPFPIEEPDQPARSSFVNVLNALRTSYPNLQLEPSIGEQVTAWMDEMRAERSAVRRRRYISDRVAAQQEWYRDKSEHNRKMSRIWKTGLVVLEFTGVIFALAESLTETSLTFTPAIAAGIGAIAAWLQTKQHDQLYGAYATTVADLAGALTKLNGVKDEDDWAREMNDAEDAISREHTRWIASRSQVDGPQSA